MCRIRTTWTASWRRVTFVYGACVRDEAWWRNRMIEPLTTHAVASVTVPLPSCGETSEGLGDLHDEVEAPPRAIAEAERPVAPVGHSYGGMVISAPRSTQRCSGPAMDRAERERDSQRASGACARDLPSRLRRGHRRRARAADPTVGRSLGAGATGNAWLSKPPPTSCGAKIEQALRAAMRGHAVRRRG
jgi:hypothetical protein